MIWMWSLNSHFKMIKTSDLCGRVYMWVVGTIESVQRNEIKVRCSQEKETKNLSRQLIVIIPWFKTTVKLNSSTWINGRTHFVQLQKKRIKIYILHMSICIYVCMYYVRDLWYISEGQVPCARGHARWFTAR